MCVSGDAIGFCVIVTGTSGIGKSLFYYHVFNMLRKLRPGTTFVTASFNQNQNFENAFVFVPNSGRRQAAL
jgi:KaiC/GvpD/RAD55 family RecA-like ATPase